ncbi:putative Rho-GTPase-activating protein 6 [Trichoderma lentiforme]|uniref:Rho-GTPase-activating protein 6 n=1 Tax=Trichoderma lentiforme TaxID=1567552 RepID=A0A9P4X6Q6_9HYPO|nr:putative Rho-GTPase-activating protein 6 [Trichoderma lentiforme]
MVSFTNPLAGSFTARQRSNPPSIQSAEPAFVPPANRARYVPNSASQAFPLSEVIPELIEDNPTIPTSRTWTPSTRTLNFSNDEGEEQDRSVFVERYNQVATKSGSSSPEKKSWLSRIFRGSSNQSTPKRATPGFWAHKRSTSDLGSSIRSKSEPRILDIQDLVRLTGSSLLYLPPGFSPHPLALPTCIRATAHYLAENSDFRGVFRIPGSVKTTKALYDYYCDASGSDLYISSTTYQPTLPTSIPHHLHDVASTFKRILKGLPIGVLGSITLLDAFLAIYSQQQNRLDVPAEKLEKTRARLIALAIQTIDSRLQRDLICAVFGLLSLIGHATEQSLTCDAEGQASAPSELMSYHALGIIFGSLLVGLDELDNYDIKESPTSGLSLVPIPAKKRCHRQKAKGRDTNVPDFFKVEVVNNIAEMVISNWQDVVRQMLLLSANPDQKTASMQETHDDSESSICESFVVNRTMDLGLKNRRDLPAEDQNLGFTTVSLSLRRTRSAGSRLSRQGSGRGPSRQSSLPRMTPTMEEGHQRNPSNSALLPTTPTSGMVGPASTSTRNVTPSSKQSY